MMLLVPVPGHPGMNPEEMHHLLYIFLIKIRFKGRLFYSFRKLNPPNFISTLTDMTAPPSHYLKSTLSLNNFSCFSITFSFHVAPALRRLIQE